MHINYILKVQQSTLYTTYKACSISTYIFNILLCLLAGYIYYIEEYEYHNLPLKLRHPILQFIINYQKSIYITMFIIIFILTICSVLCFEISMDISVKTNIENKINNPVNLSKYINTYQYHSLEPSFIFSNNQIALNNLTILLDSEEVVYKTSKVHRIKIQDIMSKYILNYEIKELPDSDYILIFLQNKLFVLGNLSQLLLLYPNYFQFFIKQLNQCISQTYYQNITFIKPDIFPLNSDYQLNHTQSSYEQNVELQNHNSLSSMFQVENTKSMNCVLKTRYQIVLLCIIFLIFIPSFICLLMNVKSVFSLAASLFFIFFMFMLFLNLQSPTNSSIFIDDWINNTESNNINEVKQQCYQDVFRKNYEKIYVDKIKTIVQSLNFLDIKNYCLDYLSNNSNYLASEASLVLINKIDYLISHQYPINLNDTYILMHLKYFANKHIMNLQNNNFNILSQLEIQELLIKMANDTGVNIQHNYVYNQDNSDDEWFVNNYLLCPVNILNISQYYIQNNINSLEFVSQKQTDAFIYKKLIHKASNTTQIEFYDLNNQYIALVIYQNNSVKYLSYSSYVFLFWNNGIIISNSSNNEYYFFKEHNTFALKLQDNLLFLDRKIDIMTYVNKDLLIKYLDVYLFLSKDITLHLDNNNCYINDNII